MTLSRAQQVETREREAKVLELRKACKPFHEIATELGYADASGAKRAYDRAMLATIQEPAEAIRKIELERLDSLMAGLWPNAMKGDVQAVDRCLSIMNRRAKMLGLDAPTRQTVTVVTRDAVESAIAELEAQLADNDPAESRS